MFYYYIIIIIIIIIVVVIIVIIIIIIIVIIIIIINNISDHYSSQSPLNHSFDQELRERVLRGKYRIPFYMSTDCENLLKKFLILNPIKRASLEVVRNWWWWW